MEHAHYGVLFARLIFRKKPATKHRGRRVVRRPDPVSRTWTVFNGTFPPRAPFSVGAARQENRHEASSHRHCNRRRTRIRDRGRVSGQSSSHVEQFGEASHAINGERQSFADTSTATNGLE